MFRVDAKLVWLAILSLALVVRLLAAWGWESRLAAGQRFFFGDSDGYWVLGQAIARGDPYQYETSERQVFRTPGYPLLLAIVFRLCGPDAPVMAGRALGAILGTAAVGLVGWWTSMLFDGRAGRVAAAIAAIYPGAIAMSIFVLSEAPFCPFMLAQLATWTAAWRGASTGKVCALALAAGAAGGYATLIRPSWLLFTPLAVVLAVAIDRGKRQRQLMFGAVMLATLALVMLPWWIRNYRVTGHFVATTLETGASLYDGLNPKADGSSNMDFVAGFEQQLHAAEPDLEGAAFEYRLNSQIGRASIDWAREHPRRVLELALVKLARIWNVWPNEASLSRWPVRMAVLATYVPLLGLALVGAWRFTARGWPYLLAWLPAVYITLLHMVFVGSIRYREPAMLALTVLAAGVIAGAGARAAGWPAPRRCRRLDEEQAAAARGRDRGTDKAQGTAAITKGLVNFCWFFFKWGIALALVVALAASPWVYRKVFFKVEEALRSQVEARIAEYFPQLTVRLESAHLASDGIVCRGLSISENGAPGPQPELVYFEELYLACRTSPQELLAGHPTITAVRARRPVLRAMRRSDNTYSLAKLFVARSAERPPPTTIEDGMVVIFDPIKNPSCTLTLHELNVSLKPADEADGEPDRLDVEGHLNGEHVGRVDLTGAIDPASGRWSIGGHVESLSISPEFRAALPEHVADRLKECAAVRGQVQLDFRLSGQGAKTVPRFDVDGRVTHGQIEDARLPMPLTDLRATFHCDNELVRLTDLSGRQGQATWRVPRFERHGYTLDSPLMLEAHGQQVHLDRSWMAGLSEPWQTYWRNYDPEGHVDIDCELSFDGRAWHPKLVVRSIRGLEDVSFACHRFPYRLSRASGMLALTGNVLDAQITGHSGSLPVMLSGRFFNPGPQFTGSIEIRGEKIPFDEPLYAALLKPRSREMLRSLDPRGTFSFYTRLWRDNPQVREVNQYLQVALGGGSMKYDKFRYELQNLQGTLTMRDGQWSIGADPAHPVTGTNGTGVVSLSGSLATSEAADALTLAIRGKNVPLDEDLRAALPDEGQRRLWDSLQPHGKIDLTAAVKYNSRDRKADVDLWAYPPNRGAVDVVAQSHDDAAPWGTSIEPVAFPYLMRIVDGAIHYRNGHADLETIYAVHRTTQIHTNGKCDLLAGGGWQLQLRDLSVDRVRLHGEDRELEAALPMALKRAVAELKPKGAINFSGNVDLVKSRPEAPLATGWDVNVFLHKASLQVGPSLENIDGRIRLTGSSNGPRYASRGELDLDSLTYKNFQLTNCAGPLSFDNDRAVLGDWGPQSRQAGARNRRVTAHLLGGLLSGDCLVEFGPMPHYHLSTTFSELDLAEFARDNLPTHRKLAGKLRGDINLEGMRRTGSLFGSGNIHLSKANVYELPLMVSLLAIVRAKVPAANAFSESDAAFDIRGEHLYLKSLQLNGDALNLSGEGEVTLDGQTNPVNLKLYSKVLRGNVPVVSSIMKRASQQIMTIHVEGTLDHPVARAEAFPVANQALQQLQLDRQDERGSSADSRSLWPFTPAR